VTRCILVSEEVGRRVQKSAQRSRLSTSAWVRQAIERALVDDRAGGDVLDRLSQLEAPTGDITQLLAEIDAGRSG
jgi:predicted transcriptional regulator